MATKYSETLLPQVIYVFRICDEDHQGCLKIGMTKLTGQVDVSNLPANCDALNTIAKERIDEYTATAATHYELLHTECSLFFSAKGLGAFDDHQVHDILLRSGIKKKVFSYNEKAREWFITDLQTVKNAITAAKDGRKALLAAEISYDKSPIEFRPEQRKAIDRSVDKFQIPGTRMLWNCKMRFGKTLSALQVVKEMRFHHTIIVTHRPVVDDGWFEDYDKIFYDNPYMHYSSKNRGEDLEDLINLDKSFIYFASMQDLRGSADVGGKFDKNNIVFSVNWDLLIIDEAHEGTKTILGQKVIKALTKRRTCVINLSGTPFNIVSEFNEDEIVNWTYVDEQREKERWAKEHPCDYNPYGGLPRMNMAIYDLNEVFDKYEALDGDIQFNFREFFRVWTGIPAKDHRRMPNGAEIGSFIHEKDVNKFLDLLVKPDPKTNYPFSTEEYRKIFRHTFWIVPGVDSAKALSALLKKHEVFSLFDIVNVAGDGDDDEDNEEALKKVRNAITDKPEETYTITLSCGKLTTGVSVKAWTGVMMLYGSKKTKAQTYMQTIFRVQTPATIGGMRKEECYVFDFAPDRIITAIDETIRTAAYAERKPGIGKSVITDEERKEFEEYLKYCPVIAYDGSMMREYNVNELLDHLKRVQIERVVRNGFEDDALYNNDVLMNLDKKAIDELEGIKGIIGSSKAQAKMGDFIVNDQGLDKEDTTNGKQLKKELTEEEKKARKELAAKKKKKQDAISILRGISIRLPMLIYGADVKDEAEGVTLENFTSFIDKDSWKEFMPEGITMQKFHALRKYYDPDIFRACGKRIRRKASDADSLPPLQRIHRITDIFQTFRNPDKETVLTPWRAVNMHISDTLGGYDFFDEDHALQLEEPRYVDKGRVTYKVFEKEDTHILELNSKSGLYPLYMTYGVYRERLKQWISLGLIDNSEHPTLDDQLAVWDDVIGNNIFVLCKTPMAVRITKRTLVGFRDVSCNIRYIDNLIDKIQNEQKTLTKKIKQGKSFWHVKNETNMINFDAILGNPPYMIMDGGAGVSATPLYHRFVDLARGLKPGYISMIMPSRWFSGGKGLDNFRNSMMEDRSISYIYDYEHSFFVFPQIEIAGGVCYFLWDSLYNGNCHFTNINAQSKSSCLRDLNQYDIIVRQNHAIKIIDKIKKLKINDGHCLSDVVSASKPFGLRGFYTPRKEGIPCWFNQKKGLKFADPNDYTDEWKLKDKWKLLIPRAPIAGQTDFSKPVGFYYDGNVVVSKPGEICTESYVVAYSSDTEEEILSFKSYLFTKIFRFLLLQSVVSQDVVRSCFRFVPDLGKYDGVYSDDLLCSEWKISDTEWKYIDSRIRNVEDIGKNYKKKNQNPEVHIHNETIVMGNKYDIHDNNNTHIDVNK